MKYIDLLQRLQHNPDEAVIVYRGCADRAAWIINRQGVVQHIYAVDKATLTALKGKGLRQIASLVPSRAAILRPVSDFKHVRFERRKHRMGRRYTEATSA